MLNRFVNYLLHEKRCSLHTVTAYSKDLEQFEAYNLTLLPNFTLQNAQFQHIRSWLLHLVHQEISARSINRKSATLRSYYKFLQQTSHRIDNPTTKIQPLKTPKDLPSFVMEKDILNLLDRFPFTHDFYGQRDRLILELLYGTGIRLSELISLTEANTSTFNAEIKVLGKRNKERIIPISRNLIKIITNYLNLKKELFKSNREDELLVTNKGEACYPMFIYRTVHNFLSLCPSVDKNSPHVLRHTFATHLLNKGADLNAVKDLLGHTSLAATQVYTHNSLEKIKSVFQQAHPKA